MKRKLSIVPACLVLLVGAPALAQADAKPVQPETPASKPAEATKPAVPTEEKIVHVKLSTSMGDIVLELDGVKAPISTENFVSYVNKGFYDGTIFHRVIDGFMIQGGGFTSDLKQKPTEKPIKNEWKNGLKNRRGTIAMARTAVADSATSQFFINVNDNAALDQPNDGAAYAVFGKVIAGMGVVDKIRLAKTGVRNGMGDVPRETITITKGVKITADEAKTAVEMEKKSGAGDAGKDGGKK